MPLAAFPGSRSWGYDGVLHVRARRELRSPGRPQGPDRPGPRPWPHGLSRRRLQPLRPRGELSAPLRAAVLHRASSDPLGRGHQLRRRAQRDGARVLRPERPLLAQRVPLRRSAARCGARHRRRLRYAHPDARSPRRWPPAQAASARCTWCWRTTTTRRIALARDDAGTARRYVAQWNDDFHHAAARPAHRRARRLLRRLCRRAGAPPRALPR